jgi:FkbM family methyltransferase
MAAADLENLARAYIDLVRLHKQGAVAEARALYQRIAHDLRAAIDGMWAQGRRQLGAGDHYGALLSFEKVLEIQRQDLMNLAPADTRTACFAEMARVLTAMNLPLAAAAATTMAERGGASFYRPSASCQIAVLAGLYEQLFGECADGTFVEVGAYDGETFSNTSCLADLGWRGLYIEPVERSYRQCAERHRANTGVTVLNCAIGPTETTIRFWDNGEFSTGSPDEMAVNQANNWIGSTGAREIAVRQIRLDAALRDAGIASRFDLLVVDVDGMEEQVFDSFALAEWRPRCMIVELIEASPGFVGHESLIASSARVRAAIARAGYETVYRDQGNTVFRDTAG